MTAVTVRNENIITIDTNDKPMSVYWSAVNDPTMWNVMTDIVSFDDPLNDPHAIDRMSGFVPLSDPKPTTQEPKPQPFPVQAMNSHWHWRHG